MKTKETEVASKKLNIRIVAHHEANSVTTTTTFFVHIEVNGRFRAFRPAFTRFEDALDFAQSVEEISEVDTLAGRFRIIMATRQVEEAWR